MFKVVVGRGFVNVCFGVLLVLSSSFYHHYHLLLLLRQFLSLSSEAPAELPLRYRFHIRVFGYWSPREGAGATWLKNEKLAPKSGDIYWLWTKVRGEDKRVGLEKTEKIWMVKRVE